MKLFGDLPPEMAGSHDASVVIVPVPFDGTSTWGKGADKGPEALLEASGQLELYDIETDTEVYKNGIHTDNPVRDLHNPETMVQSVFDRVSKWLERKKFVVLIGGEHSISIGAVKAFGSQFSNLSVLQFDAHADLRDSYEGSRYNHACVAARLREVCPVTQVGIRSMDAGEKQALKNVRSFFAHRMKNDPRWIGNMIDTLNDNVYLTFDLDVLDPSIMASTGTPEPGGMLWYDVLDVLHQVIEHRNLVGFDIVELCPNPLNQAPDFTAAKLLYKILSYHHSFGKNE